MESLETLMLKDFLRHQLDPDSQAKRREIDNALLGPMLKAKRTYSRLFMSGGFLLSASVFLLPSLWAWLLILPLLVVFVGGGYVVGSVIGAIRAKDPVIAYLRAVEPAEKLYDAAEAAAQAAYRDTVGPVEQHLAQVKAAANEAYHQAVNPAVSELERVRQSAKEKLEQDKTTALRKLEAAKRSLRV